MSKGSRDRTADKKRFDRNYEQIDFSKPVEFCKKCKAVKEYGVCGKEPINE